MQSLAAAARKPRPRKLTPRSRPVRRGYVQRFPRVSVAASLQAFPHKAFGLIPAPAACAPRARPPAQGPGTARPGLAAPWGFRARSARGAPARPAT